MTFRHAVLWMDHQQAIIIGLAPNLTHRKLVQGGQHPAHRRHDTPDARAEHDRPYFLAVAEALGETSEILLLGAGGARNDFLTWLQAHRPELARHILKNAAWDHARDDELAAEGRRFFKAADRILPAHSHP